jgi:hypothetical protein
MIRNYNRRLRPNESMTTCMKGFVGKIMARRIDDGSFAMVGKTIQCKTSIETCPNQLREVDGVMFVTIVDQQLGASNYAELHGERSSKLTSCIKSRIQLRLKE